MFKAYQTFCKKYKASATEDPTDLEENVVSNLTQFPGQESYLKPFYNSAASALKTETLQQARLFMHYLHGEDPMYVEPPEPVNS